MQVVKENSMKAKTRRVRWFGVTLVVATVIAAIIVAAGCTKNTEKPEATPIKVGANLSLTGPVAFWGQSILDGLRLAAEDYAKQHPDKPIQLVAEDNQGDPKVAVSAMRKLTTVDHVTAVVSAMTPFSKPLRPLAAQARTPLIASVVVAKNFGAENEWSFRDYPTPEQLGGSIAEYGYKTLALRRAVCLVVDDEYGRDAQALFTERFTALGGEVLGSDTAPQKDSDVRGQVTKLLRFKPDTAYIVIRENTLGVAIRQFRELGFRGQILGINSFDSPVVWRAAGSAANGATFSNVHIDYERNAAAKAFVMRFKQKYGQEPNNTQAYGYSIGTYLFPIAAESGGDPTKARALLSSMTAGTLRGQIRMLPSRDVQTSVAIYRRQGDQTVLLRE
jgi:branched-chain amino acid transport system substrate-binding protein